MIVRPNERILADLSGVEITFKLIERKTGETFNDMKGVIHLAYISKDLRQVVLIVCYSGNFAKIFLEEVVSFD